MAEIGHLTGSKPTPADMETTLGLLALARGDPGEAVDRLEGGVPERAPDLVEAYVRAGRGEDAQRVAAIDAEAARESSHPWTSETSAAMPQPMS